MNLSKKITGLALAGALALSLAACGTAPASGAASGSTAASAAMKTLVVGATVAPHAEILEAAKPLLAAEGIELVIKEFDDYVLPNTALDEGELDANYFQHQPYLDLFNEKNGTELISAGSIHYEPLGIYPGKSSELKSAKGLTIAVPNDGSNEARALYLLEAQGLVTIDHAAGYEATPLDIPADGNPNEIKFVEMDADKLPSAVPDVDFAVINGNYAIASGINETVLVTEDAKGESAQTYANIIAVRKGDEAREEIKALVRVLQGDEIKKFIDEKYKGSVVALR
ncbi:MAG: MetQ/NlpA family ABC transporter substrate-binding protein [Ruthenibacterium sp.]